MASPTGRSDDVRSSLLATSITEASTQGDECFKEPVDFPLIADVVRRRGCSLASNSDRQQLTRSIELKDILVSFVISYIKDRVAREVRALALQSQTLMRCIRHEAVDNQLSANKAHIVERSRSRQNSPPCRVPLPGLPIVNRH